MGLPSYALSHLLSAEKARSWDDFFELGDQKPCFRCRDRAFGQQLSMT